MNDEEKVCPLTMPTSCRDMHSGAVCAFVRKDKKCLKKRKKDNKGKNNEQMAKNPNT